MRKYLFWKTQDGIRAYKVTPKGNYEIMHPDGKDIFEDGDWNNFFSWFHKPAAIVKDDYIDFCFLSNERIESQLLKYEYNSSAKSSWAMQEIEDFCNEYLHSETYEIVYSEDKSFFSQNGNIFDPSRVNKMYLKCIPEFSAEEKESVDTWDEETSILCGFFLDKLKELTGKL